MSDDLKSYFRDQFCHKINRIVILATTIKIEKLMKKKLKKSFIKYTKKKLLVYSGIGPVRTYARHLCLSNIEVRNLD